MFINPRSKVEDLGTRGRLLLSSDGSVRIGTASDGTIVRVHIDESGTIHGYPISYVLIIIGVIFYAINRNIDQ